MGPASSGKAEVDGHPCDAGEVRPVFDDAGDRVLNLGGGKQRYIEEKCLNAVGFDYPHFS